MNQIDILSKTAERSGLCREDVEKFYEAFVYVMADVLKTGETADFMPDFGRFIPKERDNPGLNEHSPRTPKKPRHIVCFKVSREFERKLASDESVKGRITWEKES